MHAPAGTRVCVSHTVDEIRNADKLVVPGQGAAAHCMQALTQYGLQEVLIQSAQEKPFLGICMGLQLLLDHSVEDGGTQCLGLYDGEVRHLNEHTPATLGHKIPHMGWNQVAQKAEHPLWHGIEDNSYFYFAHSYYAVPHDPNLIAGTTEYGEEFSCAIADNYVFAVQFHPEKSAATGLQILKNFVAWDGAI